MISENGIVIRDGDPRAGTVWVKMIPAGACESCSSRNSCNPGAAGNEREVEVLNGVGARIGDRIDVTITSTALLKTTFILYVIPVFCMLIGGFAGDAAAKALSYTDTSHLAALSAVMALAVSLFFVKTYGNRMAQRANYRPRALRITVRADRRSASAEGLGPCPSQRS